MGIEPFREAIGEGSQGRCCLLRGLGLALHGGGGAVDDGRALGLRGRRGGGWRRPRLELGRQRRLRHVWGGGAGGGSSSGDQGRRGHGGLADAAGVVEELLVREGVAWPGGEGRGVGGHDVLAG